MQLETSCLKSKIISVVCCKLFVSDLKWEKCFKYSYLFLVEKFLMILKEQVCYGCILDFKYVNYMSGYSRPTSADTNAQSEYPPSATQS